MWYVIQVYSGREKYCEELIRNHVEKQLMDECRIPRYLEPRKKDGIWISEERILFPGYLFIKSSHIEDLFFQLKRVPRMTKILRMEEAFIPLNAAEEAFILQFTNEDQIVEVSKGVIQNKKVKVLSGPLVGYEGFIRKVDRHKRHAWLNISFGEWKDINVRVGLEIIKVI